MTQIKIFCYRRKSLSTTVNNTFQFDSVLGLGINPNLPYELRFRHDSVIYWDDFLALGKMGELLWNGGSFFQHVPILPALPSETKWSTVWNKYPAVIPEIRDLAYRCHVKVGGNEVITWLPYNDTYKPLWNLWPVYEYTNSLTNNSEKIPNPDYPVVKLIYDAKMEEYLQLLKDHFVLHMNVKSPNIPTQKTNQDLIPEIMATLGLTDPALIPDEYFWHWWIYQPDGSRIETEVAEGQYVMPPIQIIDLNHPVWKQRRDGTMLIADPILRMKKVLQII